MNRKGARQQIEAVVTPMLTRGEQLGRSGPAWAVEHRGKGPLLFRRRDLYLVALTDQRMILLVRPRGRRPLGVGNVVLAKRYSTFTLERAKKMRPMLQLRVLTGADRVLVLEFRPRDRRVAHDLAAELGQPGDGGAPPPVQPAPAGPEPAPVEPVRFEPPPPEEVGFAAEKPSRKERRQARKDKKRRDRGSEGDDILDLLAP